MDRISPELVDNMCGRKEGGGGGALLWVCSCDDASEDGFPGYGTRTGETAPFANLSVVLMARTLLRCFELLVVQTKSPIERVPLATTCFDDARAVDGALLATLSAVPMATISLHHHQLGPCEFPAELRPR